MTQPIDLDDDSLDLPDAGGPLWKSLWPLGLVVFGVVALIFFALFDRVAFAAFRDHYEALTMFRMHQPVLTPVLFFVIYVVSVLFSMPLGLLLSLISGLLFGPVLGSMLSIAAGSIGAIAVFEAARHGFGDVLRARAGPWLKRMQRGFHNNAFAYLMLLRLVPWFPFFVVNIVPAFFRVKASTYCITTVLGITPGSIVIVTLGSGMDRTIRSGGDIHIDNLLRPEIIFGLVGLGLLSVLPVLYKAMRHGHRVN